MRKNHCSISRFSTRASGWRSQNPSITCSLAMTVAQVGHQLTQAFAR